MLKELMQSHKIICVLLLVPFLCRSAQSIRIPWWLPLLCEVWWEHSGILFQFEFWLSKLWNVISWTNLSLWVCFLFLTMFTTIFLKKLWVKLEKWKNTKQTVGITVETPCHKVSPVVLNICRLVVHLHVHYVF